MKQTTATILSNRQLLPAATRPDARTIEGVNLMWLKCPAIAREAKPGQFVMVNCGPECTLARPLSIHQVNAGEIALLFNVWEEGKGTRLLSERKKGDKIDLYGPLGNGFSIHHLAQNLLLIAGGIGIAPLIFLAQEAIAKGKQVILIYGTPNNQRYPSHLMPPAMKLVDVSEDGSVGAKGLATDLIPDYITCSDMVFACGPVAMYRDMADRHSKALEDKPVRVSFEVRMGCGVGVCYACTIKTKQGLKQVCKDGPVFELRDIVF